MEGEKSKEELYDIESKKFTRYHDILEWPALAFFVTGIVTAALDANIAALHR